MHSYTATIEWTGGDGDFAAGRYSRVHSWSFDGGITCRASASPSIVPVPYADPAAIDPEEAYVASLSSCHMLWFLDLARQAGLVVASYRDAATGTMTKHESGGLWISAVDLHPVTSWDGGEPSFEVVSALHHEAHAKCFLANSVKTEIRAHLAQV